MHGGDELNKSVNSEQAGSERPKKTSDFVPDIGDQQNVALLEAKTKALDVPINIVFRTNRLI